MVFNQSFIEPLSGGDFIKVESNRNTNKGAELQGRRRQTIWLVLNGVDINNS